MASKRLDEKTLQYLINLLKKFTESKDGGIIIHGGSSEYDKILDTIVDGVYHKEDNFIELFRKKGLSRDYLKNEINRLLPKLLNQTEKTDYLNRFLINPLNKILDKKLPNSTIYVVFPVNIDFNKVKNFDRKLVYKKLKMELYSYSEFKNMKFVNSDFLKELKERCCKSNYSLMSTHFSFLVLQFKSPDNRNSVNHCLEIYEELLALFNLAKNLRMYSETGGNRLYAISPIKIAPVFFYYNNRKNYLGYFYTDNLPFEKYITFTDNQYLRFKELLKLVTNLPKKSELNKLIFENLRLYNKGITALDVADSCFMFWNSLEGVTKLNGKGHVPERVNSILKKPSPKWVIKMEIIREKRNLYAHKSISQFVKSDRMFLQSVSGEMFLFLINHVNMLKTLDDLETIYNISSKKNEQIKKRLTQSKRNLMLTLHVIKERGDRPPKWLKDIK